MVKLIKLELILSDDKLVGDGKDDPYRRRLCVYSPDGTLLLEYDHHEDKTYCVANFVEFIKKFQF